MEIPEADDTTGKIRAIAVSIAVIITAFFTGIVFAVAGGVGIVLASGKLDLFALLVLSLIGVTGIGFGSVAFGYLRLRDVGLNYIQIRVPTIRDVLTIIGGYILTVTGAVLGALVIVAINSFSDGANIQTAQNGVRKVAESDPTILLILIPASFLLIGPGEELLFRGVIQGRLRENFNPVLGVIIASILFALSHFLGLTGGALSKFVTIIILLIPSLIFGTAYELTENLVVPSVIHGAYNATVFGLMYYALQP